MPPYVMHLESVVRNISHGSQFMIERPGNPDMMYGVKLKICEDGDVAFMPSGEDIWHFNDLTLANYKLQWRCWKNGRPTLNERKASKWR